MFIPQKKKWINVKKHNKNYKENNKLWELYIKYI